MDEEADREAVAEHKAKELKAEKLDALQHAVELLNGYGYPLTADTLQEIYEDLRKGRY